MHRANEILHKVNRAANRVLLRSFGVNKEGERRVRTRWRSEKGAEDFPSHGRAYLQIDRLPGLYLEWVLFTAKFGMSASVGQESVGGTFKIPPVALYFGLNDWYLSKSLNKILSKVEGKTVGFYIFDWMFHWDFFADTMMYRSTDPKWRRFSYDLRDLVGKVNYTSKVLSEHEAVVPLEEGPYPAAVTLTEDRWTRKNWPFDQVIRRASVEMKIPIPVSGKGESSWDCGDDAIFGMTCPASTVSEAVAAVVESVIRQRMNHGKGRKWPPPASMEKSA